MNRYEQMGFDACLSGVPGIPGIVPELKTEQMMQEWFNGWKMANLARIKANWQKTLTFYSNRAAAEEAAWKRLKKDSSENHIYVMFDYIDNKFYLSCDCDIFDTCGIVRAVSRVTTGVTEEERWLNSRGCL